MLEQEQDPLTYCGPRRRIYGYDQINVMHSAQGATPPLQGSLSTRSLNT